MKTEQEMVNELIALSDPDCQRTDNKIDSCGHKNCQFHGICRLAEIKFLLKYIEGDLLNGQRMRSLF